MIQHNVEVRKLNEKLKQVYGSHDDGRAYFRLAWSNSQTETRWGQFREFVGPIFLREYTGVAKDRLKYAWVKDRWVLEKLSFPSRNYTYWSPELIGVENGTYEMFWVFEKNKQYQKPEWYPLTKLVKLAIYGPDHIITPGEAESNDQLEFEKACQDDFDYLDNENPFLVDQLRSGSAIIVPGV